jgi:hypothetical protein
MDKDYLEETKDSFVAPKNQGNDPPTASKPEDQLTVNDRYKQNQRIFDKYENTDKALRNQIEGTVEEDFLITLVVTHLYTTYGDIEDIDLEDNLVAIMMKPYDPELPLAKLTSQLVKGRVLHTSDSKPSAKI